MGGSELAVVLLPLLGYAVAIAFWLAIGYVVVKKAVKRAIIEAHEEMAGGAGHEADRR